MNDRLDRFIRYLASLCAAKFYGEVRLRMHAGEIEMITVQQQYLERTLPVPEPPTMTP